MHKAQGEPEEVSRPGQLFGTHWLRPRPGDGMTESQLMHGE